MNMKLLLVSMGVVALLASPVMAKNADHVQKQKHSKVEKAESKKKKDADSVFAGLTIGGKERDEIKSYLHRAYGSSCPPGLAKKDNGCLPPGQAKKYAIGGVLPSDYAPVPPALMSLLGRAPAGTFYSMVDRDVVLATEGTKKILDAVTLLSAME